MERRALRDVDRAGAAGALAAAPGGPLRRRELPHGAGALTRRWVELHVDDRLLGRDPARWPAARALVERVAAVAEERGARLSLRFRAPFARHARGTGLLRALAERGHEVGAHAHGGRGLREAVEAIRADGVDVAAAAPGLVQARDRGAVLRAAARLGIRLVTDHGPRRAWAYEGLHPREEEGVVVLAPTVRPFDWGLLEPDGRFRGLWRADLDRLERARRVAEAAGAACFGVTLHEHDLCPEGSLVPAPEALRRLARLLGPDVVPASEALPPSVAARAATRAPRPAPPLRAVRAVRAAVDAVRPRRAAEAVEVAGRRIALDRVGPERPRAVLVFSHSGREGGRRLRLAPFGAREADLLAEGWALWFFDRSGTGDSAPPLRRGRGLAPGRAVHVADWRAVLARARAEAGGAPVVAVSWSAGVLPVLRAAAAGDRPDALVDAEAPADRFSLVPPWGDPALDRLDPFDDADWEGLEPAALLPALGAPYARLQAELDHVHGATVHHAERMWAVARAAGLLAAEPRVLAGRLHGHPDALADAARAVLAARGAAG